MTSKNRNAIGKIAHRFRCAIYTRKSSEEGLEQDFNSLDAQREACEAFILSQKQEGWIALSVMYDDGGVSGASVAGDLKVLATSSAAMAIVIKNARVFIVLISSLSFLQRHVPRCETDCARVHRRTLDGLLTTP